MYPSGYTILEHNLPYLEREDELDKPVKKSSKGGGLKGGKEGEKEEEEMVDVERVSDDEEDVFATEKRITLPLTVGTQVRTCSISRCTCSSSSSSSSISSSNSTDGVLMTGVFVARPPAAPTKR